MSAQPVAPTNAPGEHYFAYVAESSGETTAQLGVIEGASFKAGSPIEYLLGSLPTAFVNIASSEEVLAVAGGIAPEGVVYFELHRNDDPSTLIGTRKLAYSDWITLTAWGARAAALAPSEMGPMLTVVEAGTGDVVDLLAGYIAIPTPTAGAITTLRDHLVIATATAGSVRVQQSTGLSPEAEATVTLEASDYQGQMLAVAAARQTVAVAWLNTSSVPASTSSGGWALLECAQ